MMGVQPETVIRLHRRYFRPSGGRERGTGDMPSALLILVVLLSGVNLASQYVAAQ